MATEALDISKQGFAVQSYRHKVQQLTDVIVLHLGSLSSDRLKPSRQHR
jgi:hypothetical protein